MARACAVAALLLLCAVAAQASRYHIEEGENGRMLLQAPKQPNCTRINTYCSTCRNQRIPGTRRSELVCSSCNSGYRLRRDGTNKICDCAPGMARATVDGPCTTCTKGKFCLGGDAAVNPSNTASDCPAGLETTFDGAKSQAQCFTKPGFGRVSTRGNDGKVTVEGKECEQGTYNVGGNTAGCQKCGAGLNTAGTGSTSASACLAPAGSYMDKGIGKLCQKGTYSTELNSQPNCTPCPAGLTTATEGSTSAAACALALKGYYIDPTDATKAIKCPLDTYQAEEAPVTACTPCENGWRTKETGATGPALCLAPPGYELKADADTISVCENGFYKADWNRNPCVACGTGLITKETGSVSKDACLVPAGWGLTNMSPMEASPCEKNTYGAAVDRAAVANARCTACPADMFTRDTLEGRARNAGELYTSETDCLVKEGWGTTSTTPQECPVGTYNAGKNRAPCSACGTGWTTTGAGKTAASACVIQPGWKMATDGIPAPCDKGYFSTGGTEAAPNATCSPCPDGFSTQEDESTNSGECTVCAPGRGGADCNKCPSGTFASGGAKAGDLCQACADGTTSKTGATQSQQCYNKLIDARNDVFNVADENAWSKGAATQGEDCAKECTDSTTCVMYKFVSTSPGTGDCSIMPEAPTPSHTVGFKIGNGDDYAVWGLTQSVGAALATQPSVNTELACKNACSASSECEVYNWNKASNTCTLTKSELEQDAISMFQVVGEKLFSELNP